MPKLKNLYWMCGRCGHREQRKPRRPMAERREYVTDPTSGDLIYRPPDEKCPRCGSRNNLRYFFRATEGRNGKMWCAGEEQVGDPDPWTGRQIDEELEAAR